MTQELFFFIFQITCGWMGVLGSGAGLRWVTLPQCSVDEVYSRLGDSVKQAIYSPQIYKDLEERFRAYFAGDRVEFTFSLDLSQATAFQREVWEIIRLIPYGETRSYAWVAEQIKKPKALRAIGQALGKNPLPIIIPCHRVIASSGGLGGFSGGVDMKRNLLCLEKLASNC